MLQTEIWSGKYPAGLKGQGWWCGGTQSQPGKRYLYFYLVTKVLYHQKPTIQSLKRALSQLRERLADMSIGLLIIPKLGCALDGLRWHEVRGILSSTFVDQEVQITVCDPENVRFHNIVCNY